MHTIWRDDLKWDELNPDDFAVLQIVRSLAKDDPGHTYTAKDENGEMYYSTKRTITPIKYVLLPCGKHWGPESRTRCGKCNSKATSQDGLNRSARQCLDAIGPILIRDGKQIPNDE